MIAPKTILGLAAAAALSVPLAGGVAAHDNHSMAKPGGEEAHIQMPAGLEVQQAWARASAGNMKNGGAYITILNGGTDDDRLVAVETPVAKKAELHTHINDNGVMRMREVEGGVKVDAGKVVTFRPGSYHVMLMGLDKPLKEGTKFPLTLTFEKAGKKTVEVSVMGVGAMAPDDASGHGNSGHGDMGGMKH